MFLSLLLIGAGRESLAQQYEFSLLPAVKVSKNSRLEPRLGIKNTGGSSATYRVNFYVDSMTPSFKLNAAEIVQTIPAGAWRLFTMSWDPIYFPGSSRTIHYEVKNSGGTVIATGSTPVNILNSAPNVRAPSAASVGWVEPAVLRFSVPYPTQAQLIGMINDMNSLGMKTIILAYVELSAYGYGCFFNASPTLLGWYPALAPKNSDASLLGYDVVGTILTRASANGQKVILGLGRGPFTVKLAEAFTAQEISEHRLFQQRVAQELISLYGGQSSFYGWYLSPECVNYAGAKSYYDQSALDLDAFGPAKPVMVAPFGACTGVSGNIAGSQADIFAYQDGVSVGLDYGTGAPTYNPFTTITGLVARFNTFYTWHSYGTVKQCWAMTEAWRDNGTGFSFPNNPSAGPWGSQITYQFSYEKPYVSQIIFNEYFGTMKSPTDPTTIHYNGAATLYADYQPYAAANANQ